MTDLPVLVDADTGFGEPLSAARTVVRGRRDPDFVVWMQTRGQLYEVLDYDAYAAFDDSVAGFRADTP
jgi:2-methylisocitrate lyase-like PEP mutase family enzyme